MSDRAMSLEELQKLSLEELVRRHDEQAKTTVVGVDYFLNEINRRSQQHQTDAMVRLTKWIAGMTVVITVATIANVIVAFLIWGGS
ncbi:MAG: hypothetical protein OXN15_03285 [Chloroflexota bacterium]|nr:hypothetical protein [Chloroflexota bacterium]MDE2969114.1 hypothetical protein [Chloroflexota bacterium]